MVTMKKDLNWMVMKNKSQVEVVVVVVVEELLDDYVLEVRYLVCLMNDDKWTFCWIGTNIYCTYLHYDDMVCFVGDHDVNSCN